ncbi:uncharacterized protein LOC144771995 [Lissotriton helveticus]
MRRKQPPGHRSTVGESATMRQRPESWKPPKDEQLKRKSAGRRSRRRTHSRRSGIPTVNAKKRIKPETGFIIYSEERGPCGCDMKSPEDTLHLVLLCPYYAYPRKLFLKKLLRRARFRQARVALLFLKM